MPSTLLSCLKEMPKHFFYSTRGDEGSNNSHICGIVQPADLLSATVGHHVTFIGKIAIPKNVSEAEAVDSMYYRFDNAVNPDEPLTVKYDRDKGVNLWRKPVEKTDEDDYTCITISVTPNKAMLDARSALKGNVFACYDYFPAYSPHGVCSRSSRGYPRTHQ
jgi:hypothetical protein